MQEYPDDNQMDELFRKSAEVFEPDYDPTAWQNMAARLDAHDRDNNAPSVWLRRGLAVLLLLWLTGNYGWFSSSRPMAVQVAQAPRLAESRKQLNRVSGQPAETETGVGKALPPTLPKPADSQESTRVTPRATPGNRPTTPDADREIVRKTPRVGQLTTRITNPDNAPTIRPDGNHANPEKQNRQVAGRSTNQKKGKAKNALAFKLIQSIRASDGAGKITRSAGGDDVVQPIPVTSGNELPGFYRPENSERTSPESLESQAIALLPIRDKLTDLGRNRLTDSVVDSPIQNIKPDTSQTLPAVRPLCPRRFVVGAVFSPDLSTIGLRNFDRPGTNFGLSVQYQFSNRWSIQTGILQSQKNYRALASQYELPPNVKWAVWPSSINAVCRMIDVPLNVRYDLFLKPHPTGLFSSARWFVSAGATAYWINRETYQYNYANPNDPGIKYRSWETSTGRQGISNLNLSVGYERQLNRRLSVQAEPFLKMPLRNIGIYKIRLISTGVFMSVRYRF